MSRPQPHIIIGTNNSDNPKAKVLALYPRLDQPYAYDQKKGRSMPASKEVGGYSLDFEMDSDTAKSLYQYMAQAYKEAREEDWPEKLVMPFTKHDDGYFTYKATCNASYKKDGRLIEKNVIQRNANGQKVDSGFQLTTGSRVSLLVVANPMKNMSNKTEKEHLGSHTCYLWINEALVHDLAPRKDFNPFGETSGSFVDFDHTAPAPASDGDNPFDEKSNVVSIAEPVDDFDGAVEEPKKVVKKSAPPPPTADNDLSSVLEAWDD